MAFNFALIFHTVNKATAVTAIGTQAFTNLRTARDNSHELLDGPGSDFHLHYHRLLQLITFSNQHHQFIPEAFIKFP